MKKIRTYLLITSILLIPSLVFASSSNQAIPIDLALIIEAFVSTHVSFTFLKPLSEIISKENSKKTFWQLFILRVVILLFFDFFITTNIILFDFALIFIGCVLIIPIKAFFGIKSESKTIARKTLSDFTVPPTRQINGIELKCAKCNNILQITDTVCPNCGEPFAGNNVVISENANATIQTPQKKIVLPTDFNQIYLLSEDKVIEEFISREVAKANIDKSSRLIPDDALKRKKILNLIFSVLVFVYITLIFFHFPIYTYIVGLIILIILFKMTRSYDLIKYLKKQIEARPSEKISNIIMNEKNNLLIDNSRVLFIIGLLIAIILPLMIFSTPRIFYEKIEGGYAVRYYAFGWTNFKKVTIPETYKNEKVVSLRGNTFSNMPFLESVKLPDSIVEIRGQAFKNCRKLTEVNIPKNLVYLGGGAFYNAKSIKNIELPDSLVYLGGESFYGASSLEYIKLSNNLTEIRGDSFEYCTSLQSIIIPDNVTRIGGHAFYGASSLSEVLISSNSQLTEIGSSAFRSCPNLYNINIPSSTYINERAFKESPTKINRYNNEYMGY